MSDTKSVKHIGYFGVTAHVLSALFPGAGTSTSSAQRILDLLSQTH